MKLYYCETLNPRKPCAVARHLGLPVEFVRVDLGRREQTSPDFLALNPNGRVPVLTEDDGRTLWEANAIMCRLSDVAQADLWPHDGRQIEIVRWLSWDASHFTRHGGALYFEHIIKPMFGLNELDRAAVAQATAQFETAARVLDDHLRGRDFLVGDALSVADFAVAITLPYAEAANLPLAAYPSIRRWHGRLSELEAWREPFPANADADAPVA